MKLERGLGSRNMAVLCYALIVVLSSGFFRCHFGGNDREREREREGELRSDGGSSLASLI